MNIEILRQLNRAKHSRIAAIVVSDLASDRHDLFLEGDEIAQADIAREAKVRLRSGKSGIAEIEGREMFFNVHVPAPRLVIIGAVHISQTLAPIANMAGFETMVIDPRTAFATAERFPDIHLYGDWPQDVLKAQPLDAYTALAAVTHDPKIDDYPLISALKNQCFYVGALGSRKTHAKRCDRLLAAGMSEAQLDRIHAPIGLDIAAANPAEIAIAVMAEIIDAFRKRGQNDGAKA